jgi:hypothetical protein
MSVGVMEDYKLRDLRVSHTLGWSWNGTPKDKDEVSQTNFTFELGGESRAAEVELATGRLR